MFFGWDKKERDWPPGLGLDSSLKRKVRNGNLARSRRRECWGRFVRFCRNRKKLRLLLCQGLGKILLLLVVKSRWYPSSYRHILSYADDTAIVCSNPNPVLASQSLQEHLREHLTSSSYGLLNGGLGSTLMNQSTLSFLSACLVTILWTHCLSKPRYAT